MVFDAAGGVVGGWRTISTVRVIRTPRPRVIRFAGIEAPLCPCLRRRSSMTTGSAGANDVASQRKVGCNVDQEGRTRRQRARSVRVFARRHKRCCAAYHPLAPLLHFRRPRCLIGRRPSLPSSSWMAACPRRSRQWRPAVQIHSNVPGVFAQIAALGGRMALRASPPLHKTMAFGRRWAA
ncbi:hypothetical protein BJ912DRAFT_980532 [Pholiota molesta]|nr:hypothetical protein BJ912DRAFT_980512 [Pholiota molesta]KAF8180821.1 hypothetical protein BJ912DRAFT_980532 [Pholiota molesta]